MNFEDNAVLPAGRRRLGVPRSPPRGETLRQLSEFAVTRFVRKLRSALEFRNKHADVPFLPPAIARLGGGDDDDAAADIDPRFDACGLGSDAASWSLGAEDAERSRFLTRLEGGGAALESTDGIARVVLSAHGLVARVTYPLLFAVKDASDPESAPSVLDAAPSDPDAADAADAPPRRAHRLAHDYVWHTQTFSADACPARWRFPVALLTRAVYDEGASAEKENAEKEDGRNAETPPGTKTTVSETARGASAPGASRRFPFRRRRCRAASACRTDCGWMGGDEHEEALVELSRRWWGTRGPAADPGQGSRRSRPPADGGAAARPGELRGAFAGGALRDSHRHRRAPHGPVGGGGLRAGRRRGRAGLRGRRQVRRARPGRAQGAAAARMYAVDAVPARVAPAGRAGAAFQAARAGGEFEASQGRSRGAEEGGVPTRTTASARARARAPRALRGARRRAPRRRRHARVGSGAA